VEADVSKVQDVDGYMDGARERFGRVDLHHLNAGISGSFAPIAELSPEDFDAVIAVNLRGIFLGIRAALADFTADPRPGAIVTTASLAGVQGGGVASPYVAAKHGVIGLTKVVALETAKTGITCNAICPGWVLTPLVQQQIEARAKAAGKTVEQAKNELVAEKQPMLEFSTPESIGALAVFLAGDAAATITGSAYSIDGGWTAQ
jgi:3-hydroxybutyrate dehydrogenase